MFAARFALAVLVLGSSFEAWGFQSSTAPSYSSASIVNSASNLPYDYAPNTIVSLYGLNLATRSVQTSNFLLTSLDGVTVYVGGTAANLFYVSPTQVNVLMPNNLRPGPVTVWVSRQGLIGPTATIVLTETAPAVFQSSPGTLLAAHADGSIVTRDAPAAPGDVIVIYALGLGRTNPDILVGHIATNAAPIQHTNDIQILLNGAPIDHVLIYYAGVTPGFAGLYQINVQLPLDMPATPEVRVSIGSQISAPGLSLPTH